MGTLSVPSAYAVTHARSRSLTKLAMLSMVALSRSMRLDSFGTEEVETEGVALDALEKVRRAILSYDSECARNVLLEEPKTPLPPLISALAGWTSVSGAELKELQSTTGRLGMSEYFKATVTLTGKNEDGDVTLRAVVKCDEGEVKHLPAVFALAQEPKPATFRIVEPYAVMGAPKSYSKCILMEDLNFAQWIAEKDKNYFKNYHATRTCKGALGVLPIDTDVGPVPRAFVALVDFWVMLLAAGRVDSDHSFVGFDHNMWCPSGDEGLPVVFFDFDQCGLIQEVDCKDAKTSVSSTTAKMKNVVTIVIKDRYLSENMLQYVELKMQDSYTDAEKQEDATKQVKDAFWDAVLEGLRKGMKELS